MNRHESVGRVEAQRSQCQPGAGIVSLAALHLPQLDIVERAQQADRHAQPLLVVQPGAKVRPGSHTVASASAVRYLLQRRDGVNLQSAGVEDGPGIAADVSPQGACGAHHTPAVAGEIVMTSLVRCVAI
jgi:hypothetical protein